MQIKINEIFQSISGEAGHPNFPQGTFCTFIRFQGCNLRCTWCDTPHSQDPDGGQWMEIEDIVSAVGSNSNVVITGGEPLQQKEGLECLIDVLVGKGKNVQIETNGSFLPDRFNTEFELQVEWVFDYKLPSSKMELLMMPIAPYFQQALVAGRAMVKFVFHDEKDIDVMIHVMKIFLAHLPYFGFAIFILSPTEHGRQFSADVVKKIFDQNLQNYCIFSLQSHKILDLK